MPAKQLSEKPSVTPSISSIWKVPSGRNLTYPVTGTSAEAPHGPDEGLNSSAYLSMTCCSVIPRLQIPLSLQVPTRLPPHGAVAAIAQACSVDGGSDVVDESTATEVPPSSPEARPFDAPPSQAAKQRSEQIAIGVPIVLISSMPRTPSIQWTS
jgi:hypothetical protein